MVGKATQIHLQRRSPASLLRMLAGWLFAATLVTLFIAYLLRNTVALDLPLTEVLRGGTMAAAATTLGAVPLLFLTRISDRTQSLLLGFSSGVMLAASMFSLLLPAIDAAAELGFGPVSALGLTACALMLGAAGLLALDQTLPHAPAPKSDTDLNAVWLFVFAITVHNIPEGFAIGVAASLDDGGMAVAIGISLQDIPEGLVVAIALVSAGYGRWFAFAIAAMTGMVEPIAALLASMAVTTVTAVLPWGLAASAGAMLFVVSHEMIPQSHRRGHETLASSGLIFGFVLMMMLDLLFG